MQLVAVLVASVMAATSVAICGRFGWRRAWTVSNHVAQRVWSAVLFGLACGAAAIAMAAYTWTWLRPRAGLGWFTVTVLLLVCLGLALIAVFPRTMTWVGTVHSRVTWACLTAMAVAACALVWETWGHLPIGLRVFDVAFLAYVVVLVGVRLTRFLKPYYLYWETSYFLGFFVLWLTAT